MLEHVVYYGLPQWSHKNKQISLAVTNNEKFWVEMQIPLQVNFFLKSRTFYSVAVLKIFGSVVTHC